ncbi:hypothetical protein ABRQ22_14730 [Cellulosimicrobium sp. ES-005]|uniref:DUF7574 domain-containing protein n=1 Tax=Cellulosimicrobium sp. ES-005 TaxID=3163031 RepID=A0AAU8FWI8_9MICO
MTATLDVVDVAQTIPLDARLRAPWSWESTPEHAFEELGTIQWGEASYDFNQTAVFRHKDTGTLFIASDSGCSCPSPFEDTTVRDATVIHHLRDFDAVIDGQRNSEWAWERERATYPPTVDSIARVRKAVEEALRR